MYQGNNTLSDADRFHIFFKIVRNSAFASSNAPSILMFRDVRIIANNVA